MRLIVLIVLKLRIIHNNKSIRYNSLKRNLDRDKMVYIKNPKTRIKRIKNSKENYP